MCSPGRKVPILLYFRNMDPTDLQNEIAAGTIVNERGREAELGLELKQLEKALQELKEKVVERKGILQDKR